MRYRSFKGSPSVAAFLTLLLLLVVQGLPTVTKAASEVAGSRTPVDAAAPTDMTIPDDDMVPDDDTVTVDLLSGRTFTARVDSKTSATELWLCFERGAATIFRPIAWDRVVRARVGGRIVSGGELRQMVPSLVRGPPVRSSDRQGIRIREAEEADAVELKERPQVSIRRQPSGTPVGATQGASAAAENARRVRSLAIDATVANWDADVEVDGLLVHVYPLDGYGQVVPVRGTLHVDLRAPRYPGTPRSGRFYELGRWTEVLQTLDFTAAGAVFRLPFRAVHPEFDLDVATYGAIHARLDVPGAGTFETTASTVRIRPFSPLRDQLQQTAGHRFFPDERTGRGQR